MKIKCWFVVRITFFFSSLLWNVDLISLFPFHVQTSKSPTDHRSLLPVVVRQIHSADNQNGEDQFWVDGREIAQVTAVGLVTKLSEQSTFVSFYLDDGTGKIQVRMFFDEAQRESIV